MQIFSSASRRPCGGRHDATRSGRPSASASRWILVVNPPRERPRASSSAPPFGATLTGGGLLVGSDESGVEHQVLVIRIAGELRKKSAPRRSPLPSASASPRVLTLHSSNVWRRSGRNA